MSRLDEFVDEFVFIAKSAAGVASKKTGEVVEISKLKYQIKQAEWDIEKAYAKLGAIVYESKRSDEDFSGAILLATGEIDDVNLRIDNLEEKLRAFKKVKKCAKCDKDNDIASAYCARCGSPLCDEQPCGEPAPDVVVEVAVDEEPVLIVEEDDAE